MIAVSLDQSFELIGEPIRCADQPVLIHYQHAETIARIEKLGGWGIVRSAIRVCSHPFQLPNSKILKGIRHRGTDTGVVLVAAHALQDHMHTVEEKALVLIEEDGANA